MKTKTSQYMNQSMKSSIDPLNPLARTTNLTNTINISSNVPYNMNYSSTFQNQTQMNSQVQTNQKTFTNNIRVSQTSNQNRKSSILENSISPNASVTQRFTTEIVKCSKCKNIIMKSGFSYSCKHIICISCISLDILKNSLKPLQNMLNLNRIMFDCPLCDGICEIDINKFISLLNINDKCLEHGEEINCKKCNVWFSQILSKKFCEVHNEYSIEFYCKNCKVRGCEICIDKLHKGHNIVNFSDLYHQIDETVNKKLLNKNYKMFSENFEKIKENLENNTTFEYNKILNKIDEIILILNNIKKEFILKMSKKKDELKNLYQIIKNVYYYYYKNLYAKQNIYELLTFLKKAKYELQEIILLNDTNLSEELAIINDKVTKLKNDSFSYKLNVRNSYSHSSAELLGHNGYVFSLIQLDNNFIASCSEDRKIIIWNINTNTKHQEINPAHNCAVYSLCKLPDEKFQFASGSFGEIKLWSTKMEEKFKELSTIKGHTDYIVNMKMVKIYTKDEQLPQFLLASCSFDYTVNIWDTVRRKCIYTLKGHSGNVNSIVQFEHEKNLLGTCSYDKTIKFWEANLEKCAYTIEGHDSPIFSMIVLNDGRLVTGSYNDIKLWDAVNKKCLATFGEKSTGVYYFVELDDGRLASCSFKTINIWDVKDNKWIYALCKHTNFVTCLLVLKDGRLASASDDMTIKLWE